MKTLTKFLALNPGLPKAAFYLGVAALALAAMFMFDLSIADIIHELRGRGGQSWPPPMVW